MMPPQQATTTQPSARRRAGRAAALEIAWLLAMAALPLGLWRGVLQDVLTSFHWQLAYLVGELSPWLLLLAGICFLIPVAASAGLHPESRLYPRGRKAYAAWGIVLYLLGMVLMVQVAQLWHYAH